MDIFYSLCFSLFICCFIYDKYIIEKNKLNLPTKFTTVHQPTHDPLDDVEIEAIMAELEAMDMDYDDDCHAAYWEY